MRARACGVVSRRLALCLIPRCLSARAHLRCFLYARAYAQDEGARYPFWISLRSSSLRCLRSVAELETASRILFSSLSRSILRLDLLTPIGSAIESHIGRQARTAVCYETSHFKGNDASHNDHWFAPYARHHLDSALDFKTKDSETDLLTDGPTEERTAGHPYWDAGTHLKTDSQLLSQTLDLSSFISILLPCFSRLYSTTTLSMNSNLVLFNSHVHLIVFFSS